MSAFCPVPPKPDISLDPVGRAMEGLSKLVLGDLAHSPHQSVLESCERFALFFVRASLHISPDVLN
jgi:hypothetical protein